MDRRVVTIASFALTGCCGIVVLEEERASGGAEPTASVGGSGDGGAGGASTGGGGAESCEAGWTHVLGGPSSNWLRSQAVGPDGSVVVTVDNLGDLRLDGVSLGLEEGGFALVKFSREGEFAWARRFGGSTQLPSLPVAVDATGAVLVGGIFFGDIDIGGGFSAHTQHAGGFVAKWSASGDPVWLANWNVPIESGGVGNMTLDAEGNVYVNGGMSAGEPMQWGSLEAEGDVFVAKIFADGTPGWVRGMTNVLVERHGLAVAPNGHLTMTGSLFGPGTFGDVALSTPGDFDALLLEFDRNGDMLAATQYGDNALQRTSAVAIDGAGQRILYGSTWGVVDFGGGPIGGRGDNLAFLTSFDDEGRSLWSLTAPQDYSAIAFGASPERGFSFFGASIATTNLGCVSGVEGFSWGRIDAEGRCFDAELVARCDDDPNCSFFPRGIHLTETRAVMSGYFYGGLTVGDTLFASEIWDGVVTSRVRCP